MRSDDFQAATLGAAISPVQTSNKLNVKTIVFHADDVT